MSKQKMYIKRGAEFKPAGKKDETNPREALPVPFDFFCQFWQKNGALLVATAFSPPYYGKKKGRIGPANGSAFRIENKTKGFPSPS
jgi:hypothetical protein